MKRRTFLRQLGYAVPASLAVPTLFSASCNDEEAPCVDNICKVDKYKSYKVIVVGAGAAGLYTAWHLNALGFDVTILEASDRIGGRIRPLTGFADFDIELGAEEIHGNNSKWHQIVQQSGATFLNQPTKDYFSFKQDLGNPNEPNLKTEAQANQYNDFLNTVAFAKNIDNYSGADQTVDAAFSTSGISWNLKGISNAMLGNEYGTSDTRLSIKGVAEEDAAWTAGDESYALKDKSLLWVLETKFESVLNKVKKNVQVKSIDYQGEKAIVKDQTGKNWEADRVVVTIPLTILKEGGITFTPVLPSTKQAAFQQIGMGAGMKVIFKFSQPFWDTLLTPNLGSIIGYPEVPEIWATNVGRGTTPIITMFIMGEKAELFSAMGTEAIPFLTTHLDYIFATGAPVASQSLVENGIHIMDWTKEPFIKGAYSYPVVGGGLIYRKELAAPVADRVFFAGEATHFEGHSGTVHGAIETGIRAVEEIEASII